MNNILIVSFDKFPEGNAGAIREHIFAKMFKQCGYEPFVIGMGESTNFEKRIYDNIPYVSFRYNSSSPMNRLKGYILFKKRFKKFLISNEKFEAMLIVNIPINSLFFLKRYAKKNKIKLLYDAVEWYSKSEFKLGILAFPYIINNMLNTRWIDKRFNVISISNFLDKHFQKRDINSKRIPFITEVKNSTYKKRVLKDKIVLMYAGRIGKKDYVRQSIEGILLLDKNLLANIEYRLFGISTNEAISKRLISKEELKLLSNTVKFYGSVPHKVVLENLEESDFTVLLRPEDQRYAKAGFPTKVTESLSSGTPVICNITSDLGMYLEDMENSIIVSNCSGIAFKHALLKVLRLSYEKRAEMQINARQTAEQNLDYRIYIEDIKEFLENV